MSLKIAARTDVCSFKVVILFFYESAVGAKWLVNDRDCSWSWRERSRVGLLLQQRSLTKLAHGVKTYAASEHEFLMGGITGTTKFGVVFPVTDSTASAYRLDMSESASDIDPVFFFRENAFPNELSWNQNDLSLVIIRRNEIYELQIVDLSQNAKNR